MTNEPNGQALAEGQQRALRLAQAAFTGSTTWFDASVRPQAEAALRQFQGVHPAGSKYHSDAYRTRSRLFRPKTRATIRRNEAVAAEALFATVDVVNISAEDEDNPIQVATAAVKQAVLQYRLKKSIPWFLTVIGAYQDAQTVGVCISYQHWQYDPRKKLDRPAIELIPIENFRFDPGASWVDPVGTSPYLIQMLPMRVKDVQERARMQDPTAARGRWLPVFETSLMAAVQAYSDPTRQTREGQRTDSKDASQAINEFSIVWVHRNIIEIDGQDMVFYTLGTIALLSNPVPIEQEWFHGIRPYVMGICVIETHKVYPNGVAGIGKDVQAEINQVANQRIDNVMFAMNKRYFAKRGAQVDVRSLVRNVPGSVTFMNNPAEDVQVQETNDVTSSAYQEQDRLNLDFDDVAGAFSPSSIQSNRKLNETVGGMQLLNTNTNQVSAYQLRTFVETWVEPVLRQLLLLVEEYETDERVLTVAARRSGFLQALQEANVDPSVGMDEVMAIECSLDVNVGMGSTNPTEQVNAFMTAMRSLRDVLADGVLEKYGMDVREVVKELFGKLGYRDGARFFNTEEDPRLLAAQATIQQLMDELKSKVSPELVAAQVRKIDAEIDVLAGKVRDTLAAAFEKTARALFSSMQSGQMIAAVPAIAPVADELAKAAGYVPPPGAVDPNFPQPAGPAPGLTQNSVKDPRTGVEFTPGVAVAGDTTPSTPANPPAPKPPATGANAGIETARADS